MKELLQRSFPFWDGLSREQQKAMEQGITKTFCEKKTRLHFGGGECAGVQIIEKGAREDLHHIAEWRGYYSFPSDGWRCEHPERRMHAERHGH